MPGGFAVFGLVKPGCMVVVFSDARERANIAAWCLLYHYFQPQTGGLGAGIN